MELNRYKLLDKEAIARYKIHYNEIGSMYLRAKILDTVLDELIEQVKNLTVPDFSGTLPTKYEELPEVLQNQLSIRHTHAELVDGEEIVYKEQDVLELLKMVVNLKGASGW